MIDRTKSATEILKMNRSEFDQNKELSMAHLPEILLGIGKISADNCEVTCGIRENLSVPSHTHATDNYVLICEGVLYLTLDGQEKTVTTGEWCMIPAGTEHAERFVEKTSVIVFWLPK